MNEKEMQVCVDKVAIMDVISRYSICVDTGDIDGFLTCFTEDARWEWEQAKNTKATSNSETFSSAQGNSSQVLST